MISYKKRAGYSRQKAFDKPKGMMKTLERLVCKPAARQANLSEGGAVSVFWIGWLAWLAVVSLLAALLMALQGSTPLRP